MKALFERNWNGPRRWPPTRGGWPLHLWIGGECDDPGIDIWSERPWRWRVRLDIYDYRRDLWLRLSPAQWLVTLPIRLPWTVRAFFGRRWVRVRNLLRKAT